MRNVSTIAHRGRGLRPTDGILGADGLIQTGHHPNGLALSASNRKKINEKRAWLGLTRNSRRKGSDFRPQRKRKRDKSNNSLNQLNQLKAANAKHKRTIAGLKSTGYEATYTQNDEVDVEDAGDYFGGKTKKYKQKSWYLGLQRKVVNVLFELILVIINYFTGKTTKLNRMNISSFTSNVRIISSLARAPKDSNNNPTIVHAQIELDFQAESIVAVSNFCIMHYTNW